MFSSTTSLLRRMFRASTRGPKKISDCRIVVKDNDGTEKDDAEPDNEDRGRHEKAAALFARCLSRQCIVPIELEGEFAAEA